MCKNWKIKTHKNTWKWKLQNVGLSVFIFSHDVKIIRKKTRYFKSNVSKNFKLSNATNKFVLNTWLCTYLWLVRFETNLWQMLQNPALVPWPGSCGWTAPGPDMEFGANAPVFETPIVHYNLSQNLYGNMMNFILISRL